ncbi:MAG TPA: hypothetical protein VIW28_09560 [Gemmatimonadales bacterium]|jgi:hypothetical protein
MDRRLGFVYRAPGYLRGSRGTAVAFVLLALGAGACSENITEPVRFDAVVCVPDPALLVDAIRQPFAFSALHAAFLHAAGPMASALGTSEQVDQLSQSMEEMPLPDDKKSMDTACRLLSVANSALKAMPNKPETLPDRDGIRLVLMLAAGVLTGPTR